MLGRPSVGEWGHVSLRRRRRMARNRAHPVNLDNAHVVPLDPEVEHRERTRVHDAQAVCSTGNKGESGVFVEADGGGSSRGDGREVGAVVGEVYQAGI
jgi:hypothetical protein